MGVGIRDVQVQCGGARRSLYIEALNARGIGSDSAALRTVLAIVARLPAGRPAMTDIWAPPGQKRSAPDDECKPIIS
eukprot:6545824-Pyramimonas_sp.AAC.1